MVPLQKTRVLALSLLIFSVSIGGEAFGAGNFCADLFSDSSRGLEMNEKVALAKRLADQGFEKTMYVAEWSLKDPSQSGPLPASGEMLVTGVPKSLVRQWMQTVGVQSIGFGTFKLPEKNPGSAMVRVGSEFYCEDQFQHGYAPFSYIRDVEHDWNGSGNLWRNGTFTESTFLVTPLELEAIQAFIKARGIGAVRAAFDIRNGPRAGEPIRPQFDEHSFTLTRESCAAACTSFVDPKWLAHYNTEYAPVLERLRVRLALQATYVAKQQIWYNARNPNTFSMTLVGIDRPVKSWTYKSKSTGEPKTATSPDLMGNFIANNDWGLVRGLQVWGIIPDNKSGSTSTFQSRRVPILDWLARRTSLNQSKP